MQLKSVTMNNVQKYVKDIMPKKSTNKNAAKIIKMQLLMTC